MSVTLRVKRLPHGEGLPLPSYQSKHAAGLDVVAARARRRARRARARRPRADSHRLRARIAARLRGASPPALGLALKHGVTLLNSPGTIDADYRGELMVILVNHGSEPFLVRRGDRIAQLVIAPVAHVEVVAVEALGATGRGQGGFGSTG